MRLLATSFHKSAMFHAGQVEEEAEEEARVAEAQAHLRR
jgi:hypothetical protein